MSEPTEGVEDTNVCIHAIEPKVIPTPDGGIGSVMKLHIKGHAISEPESDTELFVLVTAVPNAAVFAAQILEAVTEADPFTQIMTAMALTREMEMSAKREQEQPTDPASEGNAFQRLSEIFGDSMGGMIVPLDDEPATEAEPKGYAKNATEDDPIRLLNLGTNPGGRPTMAPIDNRDEYPNIGGYL